MNVQLGEGSVALALASQTLLDVTQRFGWFVQELEEYHSELLAKTCPDSGKLTAAMRASCWKRTTGAVRILFEELRVARVGAAGAQFYSTPVEQNACFLHHMLQELRVLKEFRDGGFGGNKAVKEGLLGHIFESYVTRDAVTDSLAKLKTAGDTAEAARQAVGQLRKEFNNFKAKE